MNVMSKNPYSRSQLPDTGGDARVTQPPKPGTRSCVGAGGLRISSFGFLSDFGSRFSDFIGLFLVLPACLTLTACNFLKPARSTARHFVLTPVPSAGPVSVPRGSVAVGVGQVKLAAYLFDTSLAVRRGTNEIKYLPSALWAERLDSGLQRVIAANLATLLPTDQIRLSAWRSEDVAAEVYVAIEQFDVDTEGHGVLVAWWRVLSPGGEKTLKSGECHLARQGLAPEPDPSGAIATLSELVADFSRQLLQAVKEATPSAGRPSPGVRPGP